MLAHQHISRNRFDKIHAVNKQEEATDMKRKIVEIDEAKCNGCGLCANACHESAIAIVDGKARLVKDDYCDGMGDCLPECPTGAIRIVERDAAAYDEKAVQEHKVAVAPPDSPFPIPNYPSGPARYGLSLRPRRSSRERSCSSPPTARPTHTPPSTATSCAAR